MARASRMAAIPAQAIPAQAGRPVPADPAPVDPVVPGPAARVRPHRTAAIAVLAVRLENAVHAATAAVLAPVKADPHGPRVRTGIRAMHPAFRPTMQIRAALILTLIARVVRVREATARAATVPEPPSQEATARPTPTPRAARARVVATVVHVVAVAGRRVATAD